MNQNGLWPEMRTIVIMDLRHNYIPYGVQKSVMWITTTGIHDNVDIEMSEKTQNWKITKNVNV